MSEVVQIEYTPNFDFSDIKLSSEPVLYPRKRCYIPVQLNKYLQTDIVFSDTICINEWKQSLPTNHVCLNLQIDTSINQSSIEWLLKCQERCIELIEEKYSFLEDNLICNTKDISKLFNPIIQNPKNSTSSLFQVWIDPKKIYAYDNNMKSFTWKETLDMIETRPMVVLFEIRGIDFDNGLFSVYFYISQILFLDNDEIHNQLKQNHYKNNTPLIQSNKSNTTSTILNDITSTLSNGTTYDGEIIIESADKVYKNQYREARKNAKLCKHNLVLAYLKAKQIRQTYLPNFQLNRDSSDKEFDDEINEISESDLEEFEELEELEENK